MDQVEQAVSALEQMPLERLRDVWRERYGEPPRIRSPEILRLSLGFRIQAEAEGGLSYVVRRKLMGASLPGGEEAGLEEGARIIKAWRGETFEVMREGDGFVWKGARYASLSAVALAITGVKRNGPKFFGLRAEVER